MDILKHITPFLLVLLTACAPAYHIREYSGEEHRGYDLKLLEPKREIRGNFLYLSDSNEVLDLPTHRMKTMLSRGYRIIIPQKWGADGRSFKTLDKLKHRNQGVSYSLASLLGEDSIPLIILAEGFYTPVALQLLRPYKPIRTELINPNFLGLEFTLHNQLTEYPEQAVPGLEFLNIKNDSIYRHFVREMEKENPVDTFYGPLHANLLSSYWKLPLQDEYLKNYTAPVVLYFNTQHPLYSKIDEKMWTNSIGEMDYVTIITDSAEYRIENAERLLKELEDN